MSQLDYVQTFIETGWIKIENAFDVSSGFVLGNWRDMAFERLAGSPPGMVSLSPTRLAKLSQINPDLNELCASLVGGIEAMEEIYWGDAMVANIGPTIPAEKYWHVDGDFFRHFLDSYEQALLKIILWTDIKEDQGPTVAIPQGIEGVAQQLLANPKGLEQTEIASRDIASKFSDPIKLTGHAGDVYILHPFMIHCSSPNLSDDIRLISNPVVRRKTPFTFSGENICPVARHTLNRLGMNELNFTCLGERRWYKPERVDSWMSKGQFSKSYN